MNYEAQTFSFPEIAGISTMQLELHVGLYEGYVKHVNLLNNELKKLANSEMGSAYVINELRRRLGFEFNGMRLHELYFAQLVDGAAGVHAEMALYGAIRSTFGSFEQWLDAFKALPARGPGWALLYYDSVGKQFHNAWVADHEVGQLAALPIILAVDHWEHAYMVDYKPADKGQYVDAFFNALNWNVVNDRFEAAK